MNVLFLALEHVLPADRGFRVRTLTQLKLLCALDEVERVTVLSLYDQPVPDESLRELERMLPKVRAEPPVFAPFHLRKHPREIPRMAFLRTVRGLPYLVAKCDVPALRTRMRALLKTGEYDVVYVGYYGMAAYLRDARKLAPKARVVLEEHNVEWEIFDRLANGFRRPMRWAAHVEARATRRHERETLRTVDSVIAISDDDARAFKKLAGTDAIVIPPVVGTPKGRTETSTGPQLAYIGMLAWQPNVYGLDWFCRDVWPLVRGKVPDATLTIAGPGLPKSSNGEGLVVPEGWKREGITTIGYVVDLEDLYRRSTAMIAPIIGGSGVRMKLLETMKAGMPTVTTTDGAAGLHVQSGREVLVGDTPEAFADAVARVLSDVPLRARMREAGYAYLAAHHSEAVAKERLLRAIRA
jgi:glycosyltransferase involved in cell wall biosynthesis